MLKSLMNSVDEAKEKLSDAEDARDVYLEPILVALGAKGGGISHCSVDQGTLHVTRSGSCRGSGWDDNYEFPLSIFTCEDPLKAALDFVAVREISKKDADRRGKLAEIQRLQSELTA